ncbi:uncharacterized protein CC84DRAFT_440249 [Paraphaeosphaeria sporulosa]|uniref:Uncharacterized protein n=1 Tax=Paraphaeosphaeria sporulosa TaxID=1460663 RepID=A0A177CPS8_9PLEO|nr:uncharacterized protein CC84DRAFT_440249 [Paraphaeosphaeria sporulosa]OAG09524.1 hypothetical protein CC84DRAFT_440249 [Paraphaeosphaeria sporulosa]
MEATVGMKQKSLQLSHHVRGYRFHLLLHDAPRIATACNHETAEMTLLDDHTGDIHTDSQFLGEPACGKQSNEFHLRPKEGLQAPLSDPCPVRTLFETSRGCPPLLPLQRTRMWRLSLVASSNFTWPGLVSLPSFIIKRTCPRFAVRRRSDGPRTNEDRYATVLSIIPESPNPRPPSPV